MISTIFSGKIRDRIDAWVFTLFTVLGVYQGEVTIFYILYFFWWNEAAIISVDRLFYKRNPQAIFTSGESTTTPISRSLFVLGIYFVFIVVFFGFIANWQNQKLLITNLEVLFFHNWFFNLNLSFVLLERLYRHWTNKPVLMSSGIFTVNMIVLHISIILSAFILFFVVFRYPDIFTPDNLWGSVLIITPFLLLRLVLTRIKI